eukprot:Gb_29695 [translate_table: standard]
MWPTTYNRCHCAIGSMSMQRTTYTRDIESRPRPYAEHSRREWRLKDLWMTSRATLRVRNLESVWCLEEVRQMSRSEGLVIPLFYGVEPSDVRYPDKDEAHMQKPSKNIIPVKVQETITWKEALNQVCSYSGWSLKDTTSGFEGELVKRLVMDVLNTLNIVPLEVPKHGVGFKK